MGLGNSAQLDLLKLLFSNTTWANFGDVTGLVGSGAAGNLYIALHTADPGAAGNQTTNESAYTSYARVAVARTGGQWTFSGSSPTQVANTNTITFPTSTGGSSTVTYFSVGTQSSGAGEILVKGALSSPLTITTGIIPTFAATSLQTTDQ